MKFNRIRLFTDSKRIFLGGITLLCLNVVLSAAEIAAGNKTALYTSDISDGGNLFGWGANGSGQIGDGTQEDRLSPVTSAEAGPWLTVVTNLTGISDSTLEGHGLAIKADGAGGTQGTLWAWGDNSRGQLGQGDTTNRLVPTQIGSASNWIAVEAGSAFSMALNANGEIYLWGDNRFGQLGSAVLADFQSTPTKLKDKDGTSINNDTWISIAAGADYALAVHGNSSTATYGNIYGWGRNSVYQLGLGHNSPVSGPSSVTRIPGSTLWRKVEAGTTASFAIDSSGYLYSWGEGGFGGLGLGANQGTSIWLATTPTRESTARRFAKVSAGSSHTLALTSTGQLFATGQNASGQLGIAGNQLYNTFQYIDGAVAEIAAGKAFSVIVKGDGSVLTAGSNDRGQLGDGTTSSAGTFTPTLLGTVDLSLDSIAVSSSVDGLGAGDTLDFQVILRNNGTGIVENADLEALTYQAALSPALIFSGEGEADLVNFSLAANPFPDFVNRADAAIGPGSAITVRFTAEIPSPIYQGDYNLLFGVNLDLSLEESNTDNNFISTEFDDQLQFRADLQVEILSPSAAPVPALSSTAPFTVQLSITNHGTGSIAAGNAFSYRLFFSEDADQFIGEIYELSPYDDELTPVIDYDFVISAELIANPGSPTPVLETVEAMIPEEVNLGLDYYLGAVVDSDLDIEESDENNNSDFTATSFIDIQGVSLSEALDIPVGDPTLTNAGNANWFGKPSVDGADAPALSGDAAQSPSLSAGESGSLTFSYGEPRPVTFRWKSNTTSPLNRLFFGENGNPIAPEDRTISPDLFGNTDWQEVTYIIPKNTPVGFFYEQGAEAANDFVLVDQLIVGPALDKPDYVIESIDYAAGDYVLQRDRLTVTVTGKNRGLLAALPDDFKVSIWLSRDTSGGDANDVLLGDLNSFQILDNGSRFVYQARFTLPRELLDADYYVLARVDSADVIDEYVIGGGSEPAAFLPEDNNWAVSDTAGVNIDRLPDLWVTNLDGTIDFPIDFDTVGTQSIFVAGPTDFEDFSPFASESEVRVLGVFIKEPLIDENNKPISAELAIRFDLINRGLAGQDGAPLDVAIYFAETREAALDPLNLIDQFTETSGFASESGRTYEITTIIPETVEPGKFYYVAVIVDPSNAIAESDEGNNSTFSEDNDVFVGEVPLEVALNDDAEFVNISNRLWDDGFINSIVTGSKPASPWFGQKAVFNNDASLVRAAAQSGPVRVGETTYMTTDIEETSVEFPLTVSFRWKISSQLNSEVIGIGDQLRFEIREGLSGSTAPFLPVASIPNISGDVDWTKVSFVIPETEQGSYTLRWSYVENGDDIREGVDAAWVDSFSLESPDLVINSLIVDEIQSPGSGPSGGLASGDTFDLNFTVENTGDAPVRQAVAQVRLVKEQGTIDNTDWSVANFEDIVLLENVALSFIANVASYGTTITLPQGLTETADYYVAVWVDYLDVIPERSEQNLAFSADRLAIDPLATISGALEFVPDSLDGWFLEGDGRWFPVDNEYESSAILPNDGVEEDSLQSPALGLDESASFELKVNGPKLMTFWWKSETRANTTRPNIGELLINGQNVTREFVDTFNTTSLEVGSRLSITGQSDWQKEQVLVPAGPQVVSWRYSRLDSTEDGTLWVDKVDFVEITEADFAIDSVIFTPGAYGLERDTLPLQVIAVNRGATPAALDYNAIKLEVRLSENPTFGQDDLYVGTISVSEVLDGGQRLVFNGDLDLPVNLDANKYYLLVKVSATDPAFQEYADLLDNNINVSEELDVEILHLPRLDTEIDYLAADKIYYPKEPLQLDWRLLNIGLGDIDVPTTYTQRIELWAFEEGEEEFLVSNATFVREMASITASEFLPGALSREDPDAPASLAYQTILRVPRAGELLADLGLINEVLEDENVEVVENLSELAKRSYFFVIIRDSELPQSSDLAIRFFPEERFKISAVPSGQVVGQETGTFLTYDIWRTYYQSVFVEASGVPSLPLIPSEDSSESGVSGAQNLFHYALNLPLSDSGRLNTSQNPNVYDAVDTFNHEGIIYRSLSFPIVRGAIDLSYVVEAYDGSSWEELVRIQPPYLDNRGLSRAGYYGAQSLTSPTTPGSLINLESSILDTDGAIFNPVVSVVDQNYTALVTVRDGYPLSSPDREMRLRVEASDRILSTEFVLAEPGVGTVGAADYVKGADGIEVIDPGATLEPGDSLNVNFDLWNLGEVEAASARVQIRLVAETGNINGLDWSVAGFEDIVLYDSTLDLSNQVGTAHYAAFRQSLEMPENVVGTNSYYVAVWVDYLDEVAEADEANNLAFSATSLVTLTNSLTIAEAFDSVGDTPSPVWSTSGDAPWYPTESLPASPVVGTSVVRSPPIDAGQVARLRTQFVDVHEISFDWYADTTSADNVLTISLVGDPNPLLQLSGQSAAWQTASIVVPSNTTLEWRYSQGVAGEGDMVYLDNFQITSVADPDLTITGLNLTQSGEVVASGTYIINRDRLDLSVSSFNLGTDVLSNYNLNIYLSRDNELDASDTLIRTYLEGNGAQFLSGNSSVNGFSIDLPTSLAAGNYYVIAQIDSEDDIAEFSELNNTLATATASVTIVRLPDLVVSGFNAQPGYYLVNDATNLRNFLDFEFVISNQGLANVEGPIAIRVLLSADSILDPATDYAVLEYTYNDSLAVGDSILVDPSAVDIRTDVPLGAYRFFGLYIDSTDTVTESSETNNGSAVLDNDFVFSERTLREGLDLSGTEVIINDETAPYESATQPWVVQSAESIDGVDAVTNVLIGDDESSSFSVEVSPTSDVRVSFWWKVSSQNELVEGFNQRDILSFSVNGVEVVAPIFGTDNPDWRRVEVPLNAGTHTLSWTYTKDDQGSSGEDRGWVDRLVVTELPNLIVSGVNLSSAEVYRPDGDTIDTWSVTVVNTGASPIEAGTTFDVALRLSPSASWSDAEALTLLTITDTAGLAAGASRTYDQASDGVLTLPAGDYGDEFYYYAAYADWSLSAGGSITESFEDDNLTVSGSASLQVGLPDVAVSGMSGLAGPYSYGAPFSLEVALDNLGEGVLLASSGFDVRVFLVPSLDPGIQNSSQAYELGTFTVSGTEVLAGGSLIAQTLGGDLPYGIANGDYYVGVSVDTGSELVEQSGLSVAFGDSRDRVDGENNNLFFTAAAVFSVDDGLSLAEALDQPALTIETSGDGVWFGRDDDGDLATLDDDQVFFDGDGVQSPVLAEGESASFSFVSSTSQLIRFDWITTGGRANNTLTVLVNGAERSSISGTDQETAVEVLVSAGSTVKWTYTLVEPTLGASAYVDNLVLVPNNLPDLAITELNYVAGEYVLDRGWSGATLENGDPQYLLTQYLDVTVTAENQGEDLPLSVGAFTTADIELRLSLNDIYGDGDDIILGNFAQVEGEFSGGNLVSFLGPITLGDHIPEGLYYLMAQIDPNDRIISEYTNSNNRVISAARDIQITRLPDLIIENVGMRPTGGIVSETLLVSDLIDVDETSNYLTNGAMRIRFNIQNVGLDNVDGSQGFVTQVNLRGIPRPEASFDPLGIANLDDLVNVATEPLVLGEFTIEDELKGRSYDPIGGVYSGDTKAVDLELVLPQAVYFLDVIEDGAVVSDYLWFVEVIVNRDFPFSESSSFNTWWCVDPIKLLDPIAPAVPVVDWLTTPNGDADDGLFGIDSIAPPTSEAEWEALYGVTADATGTALEQANFLAYAFNRNPLNGDTVSNQFPGTYGFDQVAEENYFSMTFDFQYRVSDLIYEIQASDDLLIWDPVVTIDTTLNGGFTEEVGEFSLDGAGGLVSSPRITSITNLGTSARITVIDNNPSDGVATRFMRVVVNTLDSSEVPVPPGP